MITDSPNLDIENGLSGPVLKGNRCKIENTYSVTSPIGSNHHIYAKMPPF